MKPLVIGVIIVAITAALVYVFLQNQRPQVTSLPSGAVIYDVRTVDEYATGHVGGAILFPLTDLQAGKLPTNPKDTPIAVYCHSGRRSALATDILKKAGFKNITDMHGITDTNKYGLSIVK